MWWGFVALTIFIALSFRFEAAARFWVFTFAGIGFPLLVILVIEVASNALGVS